MATLTTPVGEGLWLHITEPDKKWTPVAFKASLILDTEDAEILIEKLEPFYASKLAEMKESHPKKKWGRYEPWESELDDDSKETGRTIFKFKQNAEIPTKSGEVFKTKVVIFDSGTKTSPPKPVDLGTKKVANGSLIAISFEPYAYDNMTSTQVGVSLRLKAVQIIQMIEYNPGGSASFDTFEHGFQGETEVETKKEEAPFISEEVKGVEFNGNF